MCLRSPSILLEGVTHSLRMKRNHRLEILWSIHLPYGCRVWSVGCKSPINYMPFRLTMSAYLTACCNTCLSHHYPRPIHLVYSSAMNSPILPFIHSTSLGFIPPPATCPQILSIGAQVPFFKYFISISPSSGGKY
jgi:hypothetical protein